jgi:hypothetical protein
MSMSLLVAVIRPGLFIVPLPSELLGKELRLTRQLLNESFIFHKTGAIVTGCGCLISGRGIPSAE